MVFEIKFHRLFHRNSTPMPCSYIDPNHFGQEQIVFGQKNLIWSCPKWFEPVQNELEGPKLGGQGKNIIYYNSHDNIQGNQGQSNYFEIRRANSKWQTFL